MDSQVKQKATHDVHAKFREFYPGDRILIRDLRKENTWWPGSVAERSGPKSYIDVLNDGRVWKRHLDHLRRDSMDSAVSQPEDEREFKSDAVDPAPFTSLRMFQYRVSYQQTYLSGDQQILEIKLRWRR